MSGKGNMNMVAGIVLMVMAFLIVIVTYACRLYCSQERKSYHKIAGLIGFYSECWFAAAGIIGMNGFFLFSLNK